MAAPLVAVRNSSRLLARRAEIHKMARGEATLMMEKHGLDLDNIAFDQEYNRLWCEAIMSSYTGNPSETLCTSGPYYMEEDILRITKEVNSWLDEQIRTIAHPCSLPQHGFMNFLRPVMIRRDCLVGPHHIKIGQDGFAFVNYNLASSVGTYGALEAYSLRYEAEWTGPYLDDPMVFCKHAVTLFLEGKAMPGYFKYMGTFYLRLFRNVNLDIVSNPAFTTFDNDVVSRFSMVYFSS
jgi:hypothetical protein